VVTRQNGFTLVEIMVAIAIIGLLAVVAAPYTASWVHEAQVGEARTVLSRAYSHAKSVALRNPDEAVGDDVAASVILSEGKVLVCQGDTACDENSAVWQGDWPSGVEFSLAFGGNEIQFNNRGQVLNAGDPVNAGLTYTLSKGSVNYGDADDNQLR